MIIDAFQFNDELEMLSFRLKELNDYVGKFVLSESEHTWLGDPKPLYFQENKHLFKDYLHKIDHRIYSVKRLDIDRSSKDKEKRHRDFESAILNEKESRMESFSYLAEIVQEDDVVITCDVDEIWNADKVLKLGCPPKPVRLEMDWFIYDLNHILWDNSKNEQYSTKSIALGSGRWLRKNTKIWRRIRSNNTLKCIPKAGWHLSWFFCDEERFINKIYTSSSKDFYRMNSKHIRSLNKVLEIFETKKIPNTLTDNEALDLKIVNIPVENQTNLPKKYRLLLDE